MNAKIHEMPVTASEPVLSMAEEITALQGKFIALLLETGKLGFNGAYVLGAYDPFGSVSLRRSGSIGDPYAVYGLVKALENTL